MVGRARLRVGRPAAVQAAEAALTLEGEPAAAKADAEVDATEIPWAEGQAFVWDDSYAHEVYWADHEDGRPVESSRGEAASEAAFVEAVTPRLILLLSVTHPALSPGHPVCRSQTPE